MTEGMEKSNNIFKKKSPPRQRTFLIMEHNPVSIH